jgi:recombination associated protein RdgC
MELRTQSRVLPPAAIRESLEGRIDEYRQRMGQEPPRGEIRRLKEQTRDELMPKALVKSDRVRGCYLHSESLLMVDAALPSKAEWYVEHLRPCIDNLRCEPLVFQESPGGLIQALFLGKSIPGFSLGTECKMQDPSDGKATGTWRNVDLNDETIRRHVHDGMRLTHLGLHFDEVMSAVLSEDGVISKLRLLEGDSADLTDDGDPLARQDTDFAMLTGTVRRLMDRLKKQLGGFDDTPQNPAKKMPEHS